MPLSHEVCIAYWERALECEIGIAIEVEGSRETVTSELNAARREEADPRHKAIMIFAPARPENELWLVKKATELDD